MKNNYEYILFKKELMRLRDEYQRCLDSNIKREITNDIQLLERAIDLYY